MRAKLFALIFCATAFGYVGSVAAQDVLPRDNGIFTYHRSPRYRESESHPLRVMAYIIHPIGWIAREAIFRPFSYLASSTTFTRSFMGYREPFDYREPLCFMNGDDVPDCHKLSPYSQLMGKDADMGDGGEGSMMGGERQVFFPDVNFDFDKSGLNDLGKGRVRQISQLLASVPSLKVVVEGHTDYKGTDEYNNRLGERRAQSVIKELNDLGIDSARMSPISYGESKPIFTEEADWARAVNRRTQFSVAGEAMPAAAAPAAAEKK